MDDSEWNKSSVRGFDFDELDKLKSAVNDLPEWDTGSVVSDGLDRIEDTADSFITTSYVPSKFVSTPMGRSIAADFGTPQMHKTSSAPEVVPKATPSAKEVERTPAEVRRLELDNRQLRDKLSRYETSRIRPASANAIWTVRNIILGQDFQLESFRTRQDKTNLLQTAVEFGDGLAITAVLVFLKKTLTFDLFLEALMSSVTAANHFVSYLKQKGEYEELITLLLQLGRKEEAAMVDFQLACEKKGVEEKLTALKRCNQNTFKADPSMSVNGQLVTEYVDLLERQSAVDAADEKTVRDGKDQRFVQFKKTVSLVDQTVMVTLYYCFLYHFDAPLSHLGSPAALRARHQLTEKQFLWTAAKALARLKRWSDIEASLTDKSLFGGSKLKSVIPFRKLVQILSKHNPPSEVLAKYVSLIPDAELKFNLAKQHQCHNIVIEMLIQLKDRQALIIYRNQLAHGSPEYVHAGSVLDIPKTNWKN